MKKPAFIGIDPAALLVATTLFLAACAPYQPKIEVEHDPGFADGTFQRWNFTAPLAIETAGYPDSIVDPFRSAVADAMAAQGYTLSEDPELLVNIASDIRREGDAAIGSDAYQAIHVQRGTFHESWRGYGEGFGASTRQQRFGEGTINVGVIERQEKALIWEGIATGRLSGDRSDAEVAAMIDKVTRDMMNRLPRARATAPSANPPTSAER